MKTSKISGFYKLSPEERLGIIKEFAGLNDAETKILKQSGALELGLANRMIENVVGTLELPLGIAANFLINGRDYFIPMALEEPSVVAAASNAAKMARARGGFRTSSTKPIMIGQIQLAKLKDPEAAKQAILEHKQRVLELANEQDPTLVRLGGGAKDLEVRVLQTEQGPMVVVHLLVDTRDAMGANAVNTMAEAVAPYLERVTKGKVYLRIVSNLAVHRLARAEAIFASEAIGGEEVVEGVLQAYAFARADPFRCATHNKGIMNGVVAVALATGNDTRALESGAHAYAAWGGGYKPLTHWERTSEGDLLGKIELPVAVGIVGGATRSNPVAKVCLKILGVRSAQELGEVMAAVGLAQNFAALRALAVEGIRRGHMKLHARNLALMAGAEGELVDEIAEQMIREGKITYDRAVEVLKQARGRRGT